MDIEVYSTDSIPPSKEVARFAESRAARRESIWLVTFVTLVSFFAMTLGAFLASLVAFGVVR